MLNLFQGGDEVVGPPDSLRVATVLERGANAEAIRVVQRAVRLGGAGDSASPELATSLAELAKSHFCNGDHAVADSLDQRLLAMNRRLYGAKRPLVAAESIAART